MRRHTRLPDHTRRAVIELYEASKDSIGTYKDDRKKKFKAILRSYYRWMGKEELECLYGLIEGREDELERARDCRELKSMYGRDVIRLFGAVDTDGSSGISVEEFEKAMRRIGVDTDLRRMFHEADTNGNGVLEMKEFFVFLTKNPLIRLKMDQILQCGLYLERERQMKIFKRPIGDARPSLVDLRPRTML